MSNPRADRASALETAGDFNFSDQRKSAALQAAEALFKPRAQEPPVSTIASESEDLPSSRVLPVLETHPEQLKQASAKSGVPMRGPRSGRKRQPSHIATSEYRRIRTLATYGMTVEQVAALYGTSAARVKSIIGEDTPGPGGLDRDVR